MRRRNVIAVTAVALEAFGIVYHLGRTWGSTKDERAKELPSDGIVRHPMFTTDHAVTIDAPPSDVWPWLVQMGWGRGGWYTYRWVDEFLFKANGPSADEILPSCQSLVVGDHVPDGPPETNCYYVVEMVERDRLLALHSTTHLPPGIEGAWIDWTWTWSLTPIDDGRTRLHVRVRGRIGPWWLAAVYQALAGADLVMGRSHLRGIKLRAEMHRAVTQEEAA